MANNNDVSLINHKHKSVMLKAILIAGTFDGANNRPDQALNVDEKIEYKHKGELLKHRVIAKTMKTNLTTYDQGVIFILYKMALDAKVDVSVVDEDPLHLGEYTLEDKDEIKHEVPTVKVAFSIEEIAMKLNEDSDVKITDMKKRCERVVNSLHRLKACMMMVIPINSVTGKEDEESPVYHWLNGLVYSENLRTGSCYLSVDLLKAIGTNTDGSMSSYDLNTLLKLDGYERLLYGLLCTRVKRGKDGKYYHLDVSRTDVLKVMGLSKRKVDTKKVNERISKTIKAINQKIYIPLYKYNKRTDMYEVKL